MVDQHYILIQLKHSKMAKVLLMRQVLLNTAKIPDLYLTIIVIYSKIDI